MLIKLGNTQIYRFFLDTPSEPLLFSVKLNVAFRPNLGDSITDPTSLRNFKVMRDVFVNTILTRVTGDGKTRVTGDGKTRISEVVNPSIVTHKYFVQPANNPNRISTWTTSRFGNDKTLQQLFR